MRVASVSFEESKNYDFVASPTALQFETGDIFGTGSNQIITQLISGAFRNGVTFAALDLTSSVQEVIAGFRFKSWTPSQVLASSGSTANNRIAEWSTVADRSVASKGYLRVNQATRLVELVVGGVLAATGTKVLAALTTYHMEFRATPTTFQLRIDSVDDILFSGAVFAGTVRYVLLSGPGLVAGDNNANIAHWFDDVYANIVSGASDNTFAGPVQMFVTGPNADGTYLGYHPQTGTVHFSLIDNANDAGDFSYLYGLNQGEQDSYFSPNFILAPGTIISCVEERSAAKTLTSAQVKMGYRIQSTDFLGAVQNVGVGPKQSGYAMLRTRWNANPFTGLPWSAADVASPSSEIIHRLDFLLP